MLARGEGSGRSEVNLIVSKRENIMLCPRYAVHFYSLCFSLFSAVFCAFFLSFALFEWLISAETYACKQLYTCVCVCECVWVCVCCKYFCRVCLMIFYCPRLHSIWQIPWKHSKIEKKKKGLGNGKEKDSLFISFSLGLSLPATLICWWSLSELSHLGIWNWHWALLMSNMNEKY